MEAFIRKRTGAALHFAGRTYPFRVVRIRSLLTVITLFVALAGQAQFQTLWEIGGEDNPVQFGFDPRYGFSWPNWRNDPPPGQVTRLPGDPDYQLTNNPAADDDF